MIGILTWISIIAGGLLILLLLLSLIGGLDLDVDVELGSTDVETDAGGLGLLKGFLTFISVSSWVIKILLVGEHSMTIAVIVGVLTGAVAFFLLNYMLQLLQSNQENVNWNIEDALFQKGVVYLKVPSGEGNGIVQINVKGAVRELKAKTKSEQAISTGDSVMVIDVDESYVIVEALTE